MGDEKKASDLLSQINLLPTTSCIKESKQGFKYCPAIFALWAASQNDPQTVYRFLAQTFPHEAALYVPMGVTPTKDEIANLVKTLVFEPVKKGLMAFLFNIVKLDGNHDTDLDRFYLNTSFAALDLILKDNYFSDAPVQQLQLAQKLSLKLQPTVLMAKFDDFLNGMARVEESKETPQAVRTLIASFRNAQADRSFLPSGSYTALRNSCKPEHDEELRHISTPRCLLVH
jgi:hypothetical protein